jgi:hypothetical protein
MKTIAFLIDNDARNSISGYAITVYDVLKTSDRYRYELISVPFTSPPGSERAREWLNNLKVDGIIYNWYPSGDNWIFDDTLQGVNKPQFVIGGHNHMPEFPESKHNWSAFVDCEVSDWLTPLPRPVVDYLDLVYSPPSGRIKLGSFGLGFKLKNYSKIVELVNKEFSDSVVDLNIHMSYTKHTFAETNRIAQECREVAMPNVNLNITFGYLKTSYDIAKFLNNNDLNIFMYEDEPHLKVTSSSLDHALSARKPIALSRSSYFSHMKDVAGIWIGERGLKDIMNDGIAPLESVYKKHNRETMLKEVETYLDKFIP